MHYFCHQHPSKRGVSLTELAISITIISLLLAMVAGGNSLVHSAKLRKMTTEITTMSEAVQTFYDTYKYAPGDMPTAYTFWGAACGANTVGATGSCNGNGNELIAYSASATGNPQEDLMAWRHLVLSNFLSSGSYTGQDGTSIRYVAQSNAPRSSAYSNAVFALQSMPSTMYGATTALDLDLRIGHIDSTLSGGQPWAGVMPAADAYSIDKKLDDGKPNFGKFISSGLSDGLCTSETYITGTSASTYMLTETTDSCRLYYTIIDR